MVFSLYWTSQIVWNTVHVISSGVHASAYYASDHIFGTMSSIKRAVGPSFGSICFGSLIIAAIQTLRYIVNTLRSNNRDSIAEGILLCIIDCILVQIEYWVRFFNKYTFVRIAIYGESFLVAGEGVKDLLEQNCLDVLINHDLTINIIWSIAFLCGCLNAGVMTGIAYALGSPVYYVIGLIAFIFGICICNITMMPVESGVATLYVNFAEQPNVLMLNDPDLFNVFINCETFSQPVLPNYSEAQTHSHPNNPPPSYPSYMPVGRP